MVLIKKSFWLSKCFLLFFKLNKNIQNTFRIFVAYYPYLKPQWAKVGVYTYILIKGVFVRFGFDELESRKFQTVFENQ